MIIIIIILIIIVYPNENNDSENSEIPQVERIIRDSIKNITLNAIEVKSFYGQADTLINISNSILFIASGRDCNYCLDKFNHFVKSQEKDKIFIIISDEYLEFLNICNKYNLSNNVYCLSNKKFSKYFNINLAIAKPLIFTVVANQVLNVKVWDPDKYEIH